ncbi:MAG: hypothetical protein WD357_05775 [Gracilimonas sp.]
MITSLRNKLKYILPAVITVMVLGLIVSRIYQPEPGIPEPEISITSEEAADYIGRPAEVCGTVAIARFLPQIGGQPTFINFGQPDPNQDFTAVIWGKNRSKWDSPPEDLFSNHEICVSGRIESHEETPQIEVIDPKQIIIK